MGIVGGIRDFFGKSFVVFFDEEAVDANVDGCVDGGLAEPNEGENEREYNF